MGQMSNYLENALVNRVFAGGSWSPPSAVYVGLFTAFNETLDGNSFTEVAGSGYSRIAVAFNAPSAGASLNTASLPFPIALGSWGTPTHYGIFDAASAGNLLYWGARTTPLTDVLNGQQFNLPAGGISISVSGDVSQSFAHMILNTTLRGQAFSVGASVYAAILTAFTSDSTFTEVSDAGYSRLPVSMASTSDGSVENAADFVWDAFTSVHTVTHGALFDTASAGSMLFRSPLTVPRTVDAGKRMRIPAGDMNFSME